MLATRRRIPISACLVVTGLVLVTYQHLKLRGLQASLQVEETVNEALKLEVRSGSQTYLECLGGAKHIHDSYWFEGGDIRVSVGYNSCHFGFGDTCDPEVRKRLMATIVPRVVHISVPLMQRLMVRIDEAAPELAKSKNDNNSEIVSQTIIEKVLVAEIDGQAIERTVIVTVSRKNSGGWTQAYIKEE